ncbi:MAG: phosphoribosylamine--glycine ligase, partial [Pseudomonadota bacterium]|nr:phosphoribosylamine--glycine ligase [Pseudomonadota bacterium]
MAKVLVIGSGGREHALCWRLKQSPSVEQVFCAPGNGGIAEDVTCVSLKTPQEIIAFCKERAIGLVVIGSEQPLVEGWADRLAAEGISVFGPSFSAARLEGSKGFMKGICQKYDIPTAAYGFFRHDEFDKAKDFLWHQYGQNKNIVIKADGLAAGKGVYIPTNLQEAIKILTSMLSGDLAGDSGKTVVIEEFLEGEEVSFFALSDGETAVEFGYAQDHKRAYDGDQGPNTGGMGAYSPAPIMTPALRKTVMETIIYPTVAAMKKEGHPFKGVLFAGLMLTKSGPKLLEYNVRFGDPETQALMMRFKGDLYSVLLACANGKVLDLVGSEDTSCAVCV